MRRDVKSKTTGTDRPATSRTRLTSHLNFKDPLRVAIYFLILASVAALGALTGCSDGLSESEVREIVRQEVAAGPAGPQGPAGPAGAQGEAGPRGPIGSAGAQGEAGPQGPVGAAGSQGEAGPRGPIGSAGPEGPVGATGPAGPPGGIGAAGSQGPTGPQGPAGSQGPTGPQGPAGSQGPAGPQGPAAPTPEPTPTPMPEPVNQDDALTRAYVEKAIARYQSDGPEAAFAYYNSRESHEGERALFVINEDSLLSVAPFPALVGSPLGLGTGAFPAREEITEEGIWANLVGLNPATGAQSPMRAIFILHDGLVFASGHFPVRENVEEATQDYVDRAIKLYQRDGLEATVDYYNSQASLEGQLYLFLIDADDKYVAHPIFPHLIGTDIKDVVGSDGQELGKEIAQATQEGIWVEYLWPHPTSRKEGEKVTWAIRHDGMIFASGYYAGRDVEGEAAPWEGVDPREYTEDYVNRAIERYERDGLESMLNYYNSVASFEGEWYLFATDENDIYIVHALFPRLKGTDIKDVVGSDDYELGKAFAAAQDGGEGVWVEYLWPHPVTLKEVRKVGYALRRDGILFASGYYPEIEDPAAYTRQYVADAIDYYKANGLDATIEYYNSRESVDSQWWLTLIDENYLYIADAYFPHLIGTDGRHRDSPIGIDDGAMLTTATEKGAWHDTPWFNPNTSERLQRNLWVVRHNGLIFISSYFTAVGEPGPGESADDALTRAYVQKAIDYYNANGREATVAHYKGEAGVEDGRPLTIIDAEESVALVFGALRSLEGQYVGPGSNFSGLSSLIAVATEEGFWSTSRGINPVTKQEEPRRFLAVLHDGLVFVSSHSALTEDVAESTKGYVHKAIAKYEEDGLEATIAYYNSQGSLDGQFYLFLIGADDIYLAHPIFPHLIGTDIKDVVGSDGQELGKEIAQATEGGIWVEYLWPHPVTRREQQKVTWSVRHDGLIFSSGYYAGAPEAGTPAWQDADPREYTVQYVNQAIERYESDGLQSMLDYYNSVASFEGEWYLFATDENDIYHVHPLLPHLIGTDIKEVVGSDDYELGKELAKATEEGVWVEYLWPHPVTLKEVPKVGYAVRRDGMLFASGYYPQVEDPAGHTQAYVQKAIEYYQSNGLEAMIAHYNSQESVDGQWSLTMADENDVVRVAVLAPRLIGTDLKDLGAGRTRNIGEEMAAATEQGVWVSHIFPNTRSSETLYAHNWAIRHDGLLFSSRYYDDKPDVPDSAKTDDALTRAYVQKVIDFYDVNGREATVAHYKGEAGVEDGRPLTIIDAEESVLLVFGALRSLEGQYVGPGSRFSGLGSLIAVATEEGFWSTSRGINPVTKQEEPRRLLAVLHDGLVFVASHSALTEDVAESTKGYVHKAIAKYEEDGLEATIAYYNSQESLDGQFYLFLIGADDNYLAHPIFPHLIGTDIKDVVGSDGQELGKEIAQATEGGIWVEYLWPHPVTRKEQQKVTWSVRHDGLIFSSGYYAGGPETGTPAWQDADPREYTVQYVNQAIERYESDGLQSMLDYYNSVASFEGEWYLFATDENDIYHVHPLLPHLIGTDIKVVVGSDGFELGKELAKATEEGVWVEYLWPHPVTLKEVPKVGYAVRRDGMLFASGYYPQVEDPAGQTQAYVQKAIEYYQSNGLEAMVAHYNSQDSVDGQWSLTMADENDVVRVAVLAPRLIGTDLKDLGAGRTRRIGEEMAAATEQGVWVSHIFPNTRSSETLYAHNWAIRYDGLLFTSRYYDDQPDVSD